MNAWDLGVVPKHVFNLGKENIKYLPKHLNWVSEPVVYATLAHCSFSWYIFELQESKAKL